MIAMRTSYCVLKVRAPVGCFAEEPWSRGLSVICVGFGQLGDKCVVSHCFRLLLFRAGGIMKQFCAAQSGAM